MSFFDSTSQVIQLLVALLGALVLFLFAFTGYVRALFIGLVVMIPFQPIDSKYGSINMAATYVIGFAMLLTSSRHKQAVMMRPPLIVPFAILYLVFFMSLALGPELFRPKYIQYLIQITSCVILFYMSYTFFRREKDLETFFKAMILSNVLVVVYSIIQVFVGYGQLSLFGVSELSLFENREDQRLVGPFVAVGITAEYLVIQSLILAHYMVQTVRVRTVGIVLLLCNMAVLVGTGNRGGFISMLLAVVLFLFFYRRYLGSGKVVIAGLSFAFMLAVSSFVMIKYTEFNVLYTRLLETEVEGFTPDSRVGWSSVVSAIAERPILGHGPRIVKPGEYSRAPRGWPEGHITYYPHSLYLYILYTTGFIGLLAYTIWAVRYWTTLCRTARRRRFAAGIGAGLPTLGMIIFAVFLVDQFKVEFLRRGLLDYQHYLAALFGMFAALGKINLNEGASKKNMNTAAERVPRESVS